MAADPEVPADRGRRVLRSLSRRRFAASLARLVPAVRREDIVRAVAGVRAQALLPNGTLVRDFLIEIAPHQVHVLNAPSRRQPALEIGRYVADRVLGLTGQGRAPVLA